MKSVKRTFINRGKNQIKPSWLEPNRIYAVEVLLTREAAEERGCSCVEWGIAYTGPSSDVIMTWNVTRHCAWDDQTTAKEGLRFWPAKMHEVQMVRDHLELISLSNKNEQLQDMTRSLNDEILRYKRSRLHRLAEYIINIF